MSSDIDIRSNWSQSNGTLSVSPVTDITTVDMDSIQAESCVLLSPADTEDRCEVTVTGPVDNIIIITDCPRSTLYLLLV